MSEHVYEDSDMEHERYHVIPFGSMREEIVRCGDCINWFRGECRKHVFTITADETEYDEGAFPMDANDFCSLGEPRGDEE